VKKQGKKDKPAEKVNAKKEVRKLEMKDS